MHKQSLSPLVVKRCCVCLVVSYGAGELDQRQQEAARKTAGADPAAGRGRQGRRDGPQGPQPAVEPGAQRRRARGHHGPGAQRSHQDLGLQLLPGTMAMVDTATCAKLSLPYFLFFFLVVWLQDRDTQKIQWIDRFIEELRTNDKWVIPALKQIREICSLFGEAPQNLR